MLVHLTRLFPFFLSLPAVSIIAAYKTKKSTHNGHFYLFLFFQICLYFLPHGFIFLSLSLSTGFYGGRLKLVVGYGRKNGRAS
jgi:hypothetical protein